MTKITKLNENEVTISRVSSETVDYDTLLAQRDGINAQQQQEHDDLDARDADRASVLAVIEQALNTGIKSAEVSEVALD
jgi:hypothetical protein